MPDAPTTAAQYAEALGAEWGTYVAAGPIDINGVRAFNAGDPVPVSHVERGVVRDDQVSKVSTKSGRAAAGITTDASKG